MVERLCEHCGGEIAIRNPSGYCDHLYYPSMCGQCKKAAPCFHSTCSHKEYLIKKLIEEVELLLALRGWSQLTNAVLQMAREMGYGKW